MAGRTYRKLTPLVPHYVLVLEAQGKPPDEGLRGIAIGCRCAGAGRNADYARAAVVAGILLMTTYLLDPIILAI